MINMKDHIHNPGRHIIFSLEYIEYYWNIVNIAGILWIVNISFAMFGKVIYHRNIMDMTLGQWYSIIQVVQETANLEIVHISSS